MKMLVSREYADNLRPFDLDQLKLHLRVDHDDEDAAILNMGFAAAAEIEAFAQIALLHQTIRVNILEPATGGHGITLPIGPVLDPASVAVQINGQAFDGFEVLGFRRPYLLWPNRYRDLAPSRVDIKYKAGFGAEAADIPNDLRLALMDQAAALYDGRSPSDAKVLSCSPHMARISARYRGVSV